nr:unnamed protein product [Callosobruchus analis]
MEMDITVKDVISKIRSLGHTHNSKMLKLKKSMTTGMAASQLYKSKIPWLGTLDFLKNTDSCRRTNTDSLGRIYIFLTFISEAKVNHTLVTKFRLISLYTSSVSPL